MPVGGFEMCDVFWGDAPATVKVCCGKAVFGYRQADGAVSDAESVSGLRRADHF